MKWFVLAFLLTTPAYANTVHLALDVVPINKQTKLSEYDYRLQPPQFSGEEYTIKLVFLTANDFTTIFPDITTGFSLEGTGSIRDAAYYIYDETGHLVNKGTIQVPQFPPTPLPGTLPLFAGGLALLMLGRKALMKD